VALAAVLIGAPFLVISAIQQGDDGLVVGVSIFSITAIVLYFSSTVYHALAPGSTKRLFRVIEHSAIFLLIAGTYSPFTLGALKGVWGWTLFGLVWGLAALGTAVKILERKPHLVFSTCLYLIMGWLIVLAIDPLLTTMSMTGLLWLIAGGLSYTVGVIFFTTDSRLRYGHLVWHLFVMGGTACHYIAILWLTR
jgi:hemolysin III